MTKKKSTKIRYEKKIVKINNVYDLKNIYEIRKRPEKDEFKSLIWDFTDKWFFVVLWLE